MDNGLRLLINIVAVLASSIAGALLMMTLDGGGTHWQKFVLYVLFFASISSPAFFSPRYSCSVMLRRVSKKS